MKPRFQESLWLPAAVLAVGMMLVFSLLVAAGRGPTAEPSAAYPTPARCVFLPLVVRSGTAAIEEARPAAYPPPSQCALPAKRSLYLPVVRR